MAGTHFMVTLVLALACEGWACDRHQDFRKGLSERMPEVETMAHPGAQARGRPTPTVALGGPTLESGPMVVGLDQLGLTARVPADSRVQDAIVGDGVMILGPDVVVLVERVSEAHPRTVSEAQKTVAQLSPEHLRSKPLDDGWILTFDHVGVEVTHYFMQGRREIDDKTYWCETMVSTAEQLANAELLCRSLASSREDHDPP